MKTFIKYYTSTGLTVLTSHETACVWIATADFCPQPLKQKPPGNLEMVQDGSPKEDLEFCGLRTISIALQLNAP